MSTDGNYLLQRIEQLEERVRLLEADRPTEREIPAASPWRKGQRVQVRCGPNPILDGTGTIQGVDEDGDPIIQYDGGRYTRPRPTYAGYVTPL